MSKEELKPEELIQAEKLIDAGEFDEAFNVLKKFEEGGEFKPKDIVLGHLIKCDLLHQYGLINEAVKLAEQTYKESLELGKNLLSVDILLIMANALLWLDQPDKLHDIIKQGEELLNTLPQELPVDYKQREAYTAFLKGWFYYKIKDADRALKHFEHSISLREEFGIKQEIAYSIIGIAWIFALLKVDFDYCLNLQ